MKKLLLVLAPVPSSAFSQSPGSVYEGHYLCLQGSDAPHTAPTSDIKTIGPSYNFIIDYEVTPTAIVLKDGNEVFRNALSRALAEPENAAS